MKIDNEINLENYEDAILAKKEILYMYYDLVNDNGFAHNIDVGKFDPFKYIDCYVNESDYFLLNDVDILHKGSAVSLICRIYDIRDEQAELPDNVFAYNLKQLLKKSRLEHLPIAEKSIRVVLMDEEAFLDTLGEIYEKYVLDFFKQLGKQTYEFI